VGVGYLPPEFLGFPDTHDYHSGCATAHQCYYVINKHCTGLKNPGHAVPASVHPTAHTDVTQMHTQNREHRRTKSP